MYELLSREPWLVVIIVGGIIAIGCTAIVCIPDYLRKVRQAEIDASLKHAMLERGMSGEEIRLVLQASGDPDIALSGRHNEVRRGWGEFRREVGSRGEST